MPGFCAGYDAAFLKSFSLSPKKLLIEDGTIGGVINILGLPIHQIDTALICYRIHQNSTTVRENDLNESTIRERELKISQHSASVKLMIEQIFIESVARGIEIEASVKKMLNIGLKYADNTYGFWEKNLFFRILTLTNCRSKDDLKFVVFRLFGFRVFYALRKMYSAIGQSR